MRQHVHSQQARVEQRSLNLSYTIRAIIILNNNTSTYLMAAHAQQACTMTLVLRDAFDNPRRSGGDAVDALLLGPEFRV